MNSNNMMYNSIANYRLSMKCDLLFYRFNISMDCNESKGYICHIIFKLTKFQFDGTNVFNVYIHLGLSVANHMNWQKKL